MQYVKPFINPRFFALCGAYFIVIMLYFGAKYHCYSAVLLVIVFVFLLLHNFEFAMIKKRCIANCLLNEGNIIYKIMTSPVWLFVVAAVLAFLMSLLFFALLTSFSSLYLLLYLIDIIILYGLYILFSKLEIYTNRAKEAIIKNQVALLNALVLSVLFFVVQINEKPPAYIHNDLTQTITNATQGVIFSQCTIFDTTMALMQEFKALKWWTMLRAEGMFGGSYVSVLLWGVFLLGNFVAHLSFSKFLLETQSIVSKRIKRETTDTKN
jgi:hypothetical protein